MVSEQMRRILFKDKDCPALDHEKKRSIEERLLKLLPITPQSLDPGCDDTAVPGTSELSSASHQAFLDNFPKLYGSNLDEHFRYIAEDQIKDYKQLMEHLAAYSIPSVPSVWNFAPGWTFYSDPNSYHLVPFPSEPAVVFDVEVCVKEGPGPVLATALTTKGWYSWCSNALIAGDMDNMAENTTSPVQPRKANMELQELIPLEDVSHMSVGFPHKQRGPRRLVVGHNVSFDRVRVKEQYYLQGSNLRFVDTMSLHIAVCGLTSDQRALYRSLSNINPKSVQEPIQMIGDLSKPDIEELCDSWLPTTSPNSLLEVHRHHCPESLLTFEKSARDLFVKGTLSDVRRNFQDLMTYCSSDVHATHEVFQSLMPIFFDRFPHPVTFAGMLEMGTAYLPINHNWETFIERSEEEATRCTLDGIKSLLRSLADEAACLIKDQKYTKDPWLWDADWDPCLLKGHKNKKDKIDSKGTQTADDDTAGVEFVNKMWSLASTESLPATDNRYTGYPSWYRSLCPQGKNFNRDDVGPSKITDRSRLSPKLLRLTWDGFPLHHDSKYGWGYLVPDPDFSTTTSDTELGPNGGIKVTISKLKTERSSEFPFDEILKMCAAIGPDDIVDRLETNIDKDRHHDVTKHSIMKQLGFDEDVFELLRAAKVSKTTEQELSKAEKKRLKEVEDILLAKGYCRGVELPGCSFWKLPHQNGYKYNVGNPLSKNFITHMDSNRLQSQNPDMAKRIAKYAKMKSYWLSNADRIRDQAPVWFADGESSVDCSAKNITGVVQTGNESIHCKYGAILPKVVVAGTVTRRATENTWMTASNAVADRIGSELRGMVQVPLGYHFVGADVDSQELWIANVLGDKELGYHGATPSSWMFLQGDKAKGTDQHTIVAQQMNISRHEAKILNYGRIYGAGLPFFVRLLMQFNVKLSKEEAFQKAKMLFKLTKGQKGQHVPTKVGEQLLADEGSNADTQRNLTRRELRDLCHRNVVPCSVVSEYRKWEGGTESELFNALERVARSDAPKTPILDARMSKALEPSAIGGRFLTSRINWVVQSSAVDYLHLMLTCAKWLFDKYGIDGRFSISIHDEVRYLVRSEDRYRAALALQITNLLTRAIFCDRLGLYDLPESVAFFTSVDIDHVLRKEVNMDCETPSNPGGLSKNYNISFGEGLTFNDIISKTGGTLTSLEKRCENSDNVKNDTPLFRVA